MIGVAALCYLPNAVAGGFAIPGQGARAVGMGGAFTAVADDGSAVYYNPAGMSQIDGTEIDNGITFVFPELKYKQLNGKTQKSTRSTYGPTLFAVHSFSDKFSLGLGLYSPFARISKFDDDLASGFRSQKAKMQRIDISPVFSYTLIPGLSIGGGPIISYSKLYQSIPLGPILRIKDESDGVGAGGIVGVLWEANKYVNVGATYRSRVTVRHDGERKMILGGSEERSDAIADFHYPGSLSMGIALKPDDKVTFAFDTFWYEWTHMDEIITKTNAWPDSTVYLNPSDSWEFRFGGEYRPFDFIALRAGYGFVQRAWPDSHILPAKPDADCHEIDSGIGFKWKNINVDLTYSLTIAGEEKASNNIYGFNGNYNITQHLFSVFLNIEF
ncbi:OmpP1/FadL family transporter [Candidatus Auribacterota bacterium]